MESIDLHVHTSYSDGNLNIKELLELAKEKNIKMLSITDHETIINLKNYKDLEKEYKINIIPGIEIPTNVSKTHIIGYGIEKMNYIENIMINLRKENEEKNKKTIDILKNHGIKISYDEVKEISKKDIITYRDIVKYLYIKKYVEDPRDAYKKYIGNGAYAYVPSRSMSIKEVLNLIEQSGGISVLAHPFTIDENINLECLICKMKDDGLSGIEIYSPKLTKDRLKKYKYLSKKYNLVETTGTDFHNINYDKLGVEVETKYIEAINKVLKRKRV